MEVTFMNPGVDYMIQRIMEFQGEDESTFWSEPLYHFYPQLDKDYAVSLPFPERRNYIEQTLRTVYIELEDTINEKLYFRLRISYIYCQQHEAKIREHIKKSEG